MKWKQKDAIIDIVLKKFSSNWYFVGSMLFVFCLIVELFWLGAFFPAIMTGDSLGFWRISALGYGYNNIQPILYPYLLHALRQIWNSPAIMSIFQITISSSLVAYFSVFLLKKGANKLLILLGYLAFVFSLPVNIANIYIHNESIYAQLILLLSIILVSLFFKETNESKGINFYFIGFLVATIASFRYEGAVYLMLVPLLMYLYKLASKKSLKIVLLSALGLFFCFQVLLPVILKVKEDRDGQLYCLETQIIGTIYQQHESSFSATDKSTMETISSLKNWKNVSPIGSEIYWSPAFKKDNFKNKNFVSSWNALFWNKMKEYPLSYPQGRAQMAVALLSGYRIYSPQIKNNNLGLTQASVFDTDEYSGFLPDTFSRYNLSNFFSKLIEQSYYENLVAHFFLWSPFYLLIHITFLAMAAIKKKEYSIVYSLIGLISFLAMIPMVTSSQFRYMYPLFYSSFFVPALYTIKAKVVHE